MDSVPFESVGAERWDAFCDASPDAWARHRSATALGAVKLGDTDADHSFGIVQDGELIAIAPLVSRRIDGSSKLEFGYSATGVPYPALRARVSAADHTQVLAVIFSEVDRLAATLGVVQSRMFVDPLIEPVLDNTLGVNPLLQFGYHDDSIKTAIVDLSHSEDALLAAVESRRQRYIKSALREGRYTAQFFGSSNYSSDAFEAFVALYTAAAGGRMWAPARWERIRNHVQNGGGYLCVVYEGTLPVAGHYFNSYKRRSYDSILVIDESHKKDHALGSFMQWETIQFLKKNAHTHYELGWLYPQSELYTQKELAISRFKGSFGAQVVPLWVGTKTYRS